MANGIAHAIVRDVANGAGVAVARIYSPSTAGRVALARDAAVVALRDNTDLAPDEIGALLRRKPAAIVLAERRGRARADQAARQTPTPKAAPPVHRWAGANPHKRGPGAYVPLSAGRRPTDGVSFVVSIPVEKESLAALAAWAAERVLSPEVNWAARADGASPSFEDAFPGEAGRGALLAGDAKALALDLYNRLGEVADASGAEASAPTGMNVALARDDDGGHGVSLSCPLGPEHAVAAASAIAQAVLARLSPDASATFAWRSATNHGAVHCTADAVERVDIASWLRERRPAPDVSRTQTESADAADAADASTSTAQAPRSPRP